MGNVAGIDERREEFWRYVWRHTADAFQQQFDVASEMDDDEVEAFLVIVREFEQARTVEDVAALLREQVEELGADYIARIIQLTGYTRAKFIGDLASLALDTEIDIPGSYKALPRRPEAWELGSRELAVRLQGILQPVASLNDEQLQGVLLALNRATWPGYIRQERAKRQGHEAEGRLAIIFRDLGIPYSPVEKATNPLTSDVQLHGVSFDLVVGEEDEPILCFKSTVHTANIGQFGESKDALEMNEARSMLDREYEDDERPLLFALADGLGFGSNTAGLDGVLSLSDQFCQFRTLWKPVVVASHRLGIEDLQLYLPEADREFFADFLQDHGFDADRLLDSPPPTGVHAGDGVFITT